MNIKAVLIAVDFDYFLDLSYKANKKYYDYFGIDLEILKVNHPEVAKANTSAVWNKAFLFDIYPEADFIIAQDLDVLPCNLKYDIRDFLMLDEINMCTDSTLVGKPPSATPFPYFKWNTGIKAYPKKYSEFFIKTFKYGVTDPYGWQTYDQYYINEAIGKNDIYVNEIPQLFNRFYFEGIDYNRTAFCHYTHSVSTLQKRNCIINNHPKEMIDE